MTFYNAVTSRFSDTKQDIPFLYLIVIQIALIVLVDCSRDNFASTRRASSCPARIRQVQAVFLSFVQDIGIAVAAEGIVFVWSLYGDLVGRHVGVLVGVCNPIANGQDCLRIENNKTI